ncbi:AAA family ATPase [Nanoarchaeota archaeon]
MNKNLLIMCGLQCSGKSTLTAKLQSSLGLELVCSDDVRIELLGNPKIINANPLEQYLVYYQTLEATKNILNNGSSVIVDATFSKRIFRQSAYFIAAESDASVYIINCVCNNYGLVSERYKHRVEQRKRKEHLFDEWAEIQIFHNSYQTFEQLDREAMPDGRPVPIICYDSEKDQAEIVYSDGSETIDMLLEAMNIPAVKGLRLRAVNQ